MSSDPLDGLVDSAGERFRGLRRKVEEAVLPLAGSLDGRRFTLQSSLHGLAFQPGGYVALESGDDRWLGQLVALEAVQRTVAELDVPGDDDEPRPNGALSIRLAAGEGTVLDGPRRSFHDALARPASSEEVAEWLERVRPKRAALAIGSSACVLGVPYALDAGGFDRHTFLCGQSGSGKTYSLGLVLERLLAETSLRIVVLDPNSDFVRMGRIRPDVDEALAAAYAGAAADIDVRSVADGSLRLRFADLDAREQAALLRLDPVADREEYAQLVELFENARQGDGRSMIERFLDAEAGSLVGEAQRLRLRARNLGLHTWGIWPRPGDRTVIESIELGEPRCLVVDLGSLPTREEQAAVSEAVLASLWRDRAARRPVLVVIDEAHNVCPGEPEDAVTALATEHAVRIAAEGRKFGIYLLVSTQRPQKIHENVLSQCDNLILMRMNSRADLGIVGESFSFVPPGLIERATDFVQGEALVAGKISSHAALVRFGARVAEEGGSDVPSTWAAPA